MSPLRLERFKSDAATVKLWRDLTALSAALLALMLLWTVSGESRLVGGAPVWMKPAKFALSFLVLFATIALVTERLSPRVRSGWTLYLIGVGMAAAMIAEMGWIIRQAARGTDSHFNFATPFEAFMYTTVMAAGAVYLVVAVGLIGFLAKRDRDAALGPGLREGIWLGFLSSFLLTLLVAGFMAGGNTPRLTLAADDDVGLPFVGWSGVTGDLRPAHFFALHAMQALPLFGLWQDWRGRRNAVRHVRLAACAWALLTLALFAQGLAGIPLFPLTRP